jgi:hypothetical protein
MRSLSFKLEDETWEEQCAGHRHNPSLVILFRVKRGKCRFHIAAGHGDDVYCFKSGFDVLVLSMNRRFPYVGMERFRVQNGPDRFEDSPSGEVFLQGTEQVEEVLGREGEDKSPIWIAKVLEAYV